MLSSKFLIKIETPVFDIIYILGNNSSSIININYNKNVTGRFLYMDMEQICVKLFRGNINAIKY